MNAADLKGLLAETRAGLRNELARELATLPGFIRRRFKPLLDVVFVHLDAQQAALIELRELADRMELVLEQLEREENAEEENPAGGAG
ncbi:MAG: hypothetical protein K5880_22995, partial [Hydrogenophaga sp.]|uniref:hypothetical protein n=1 Tax=Hydrogenophaga sp. TaxID=1904254 RepID=UPI00262AFF9C